MKLYHGTARALGIMIEREGLDPRGVVFPKEISSILREDRIGFGKSPESARGYVYFFDKPEMARYFGCGVASKVGIGNMAQVFEIDTKNVKVEKDPLFPEGSWRFRGKINPEFLKTFEIVDCEKLGLTKEFWGITKRDLERLKKI